MRLGADFFRRSNRQFVSRKWLRWFTPNCISNPSVVFHCGQLMIPPSQKYKIIESSFKHLLKDVAARRSVIHRFTCIIDEHIQPLFSGDNVIGQLSHGLQRCQVQLFDDNISISAPLPHFFCSLISSVHVSTCQNDSGP